MKTNNYSVLDWVSGQDVVAWKMAALADGWKRKLKPLRDGRPFTLDRGPWLGKRGFRATFFVTEDGRHGRIVVYGPDGVGVLAPPVYDWKALKRNFRRCVKCQKEGAARPVVNIFLSYSYPAYPLCYDCFEKRDDSNVNG